MLLTTQSYLSNTRPLLCKCVWILRARFCLHVRHAPVHIVFFVSHDIRINHSEKNRRSRVLNSIKLNDEFDASRTFIGWFVEIATHTHTQTRANLFMFSQTCCIEAVHSIYSFFFRWCTKENPIIIEIGYRKKGTLKGHQREIMIIMINSIIWRQMQSGASANFPRYRARVCEKVKIEIIF